jgi:hypothetical protein
MKLGKSKNRAELPEFILGQHVGMDTTGKNFDFQARVMIGTAIVFEGVVRTIGVVDPNEELDIDEESKLTNAKIIKAKTGKLAGQYAYIVKTDFTPDVTGLGAQAWK